MCLENILYPEIQSTIISTGVFNGAWYSKNRDAMVVCIKYSNMEIHLCKYK